MFYGFLGVSAGSGLATTWALLNAGTLTGAIAAGLAVFLGIVAISVSRTFFK